MKNKLLYWNILVAVCSGLLFGLNISGIAGANDLIQNAFSLSDSGLGIVASSLMAGALIGALISGKFAEKYGRKKTIIFITILFTISALGCGLASSFYMLTFFRVIAGLAVGASSVIIPMYISEIAPATKRGSLVTMNQFAVTLGILLAYIFDYFLIHLGENSWRYMLGIPVVFSVIQLFFLFTSLPESPRWLLAKGQKERAYKILGKIRGNNSIEEEVKQMEEAIKKQAAIKQGTILDLFSKKYIKVTFIGTMLAAFQQLTGNNAIIIFAPDIFKATGIGGDQALIQSMMLGLVNCLMTIIAIKLIDTKGRKFLLSYGAIGMIASLGYLTYAFMQTEQNPMLIVVAVLVYFAFFAASFAPVTGVIISEIYPPNIKEQAMSLALGISWGCTFLTVYFTPILKATFGDAGVFGVFGIFSLLAYIFVLIYIPKTSGKTLEEIQESLTK